MRWEKRVSMTGPDEEKKRRGGGGPLGSTWVWTSERVSSPRSIASLFSERKPPIAD